MCLCDISALAPRLSPCFGERNRFQAIGANFSLILMLGRSEQKRCHIVLKHSILRVVLLFFSLILRSTAGYGAPESGPIDQLHYADLADHALPAKIVAKVVIIDSIPLAPEAGAPLPNGRTRQYIDAQIIDLIRGQSDTPRMVSFLADILPDARGKQPKLKKSVMLIFARPVPARSGFVQLEATNALLNWTPTRESLVRSILLAATAPDSPPNVSGIESAFSVDGTVPGERETQIFLQTDSRPVSITVTRRANEEPHWSLASGEIADHGAPPPPHDTLLWYLLACHLPLTYPEAKLDATPAAQANAIRADYAVVMKDLGPCRPAR